MIEIDRYLYPFDNPVVRRNLGYGPDITQFAGMIKDYRVAVDGGAMVGRVANRLGVLFDLVYAIELSAENYACLLKNRDSNVIAIHGCLGDKQESVGYLPDKHPASPVYCVAKDGNVKGVTIDGLNLSGCGLIKLDLQGYDLFALRGATETVRKFRPLIYLEADDGCLKRYGVSKEDIAAWMKEHSYKLVGEGGDDQLWAYYSPPSPSPSG